ncbi:hypothetical protein NE865_01704 [Phthorimaea operculella]|nr:hypothetical protein NE865_01704 [Phthorimaea operculella]
MSEITQKCCFCLPLRGGLLFLTYLNVIGWVFGLALDAVGLQFVYNWSLMDVVAEIAPSHSLGVYYEYLPCLIDLAFGTALIFALHTNNTMVLYVYIWYSMTYIAITLYIGMVVLCGEYRGGFKGSKLLLMVAINILYQGWIAFMVYKMRIEIVRNQIRINVAATNENKYCPKQLTNDSDVESQPLPSAPAPAPAAATSL